MTVNADGTFSGDFHDSDMGGQGVTEDGVEYMATVYISEFSGKFSTPTKIDDYTYSTRVESMSYETAPGTEEVIDDVLYAYDIPYGLDEGDEFLICLPSTPVSEIPVGAANFRESLFEGHATADRYILFNETESAGFL